MIDIKEEISNFMSTHEVIVSHNMEGENVQVKFTTFGNRAGRKALFDVIKMLDDEMKSKVIEMMKNKQII